MPDENSCVNKNRRQLLKTVGAGVTIPSVGTQLNIINDSRSYIKIDTHKSGDEVVRRESVAKSWWEHVTQAREIRQSIGRRFLGKSGVKSIELRKTCNTVGNRNRFEVRLGVESKRAANDLSLPESKDGINISYEVTPDFRLMGNCHNYGDYPNMPGGVEINITPGGSGATSTCAVKDTDVNETRMMTANHVLDTEDGCDGTDNTGNTVYQDNTSLGRVTKNDLDLDFGLVNLSLNSSYNYQNKILNSSSNSRIDVAGYVSYNGVCVKACAGCSGFDCTPDTVRKQGLATGSKSGNIIGIDYISSTCPTFNGDGIRTDMVIGGGDSGGPMYDYYDGDAYILAINSGSAGSGEGKKYCRNSTEVYYEKNEATGPSAYSIYNNHPVEFDI